jgi:hypothetical protein
VLLLVQRQVVAKMMGLVVTAQAVVLRLVCPWVLEKGRLAVRRTVKRTARLPEVPLAQGLVELVSERRPLGSPKTRLRNHQTDCVEV